MQLNEVISIIENKIKTLKNQRDAFANIGDLDGVIRIDSEIDETLATLESIKN